MKPSSVTLKPTALSTDGRAIARSEDGRVVFVEGALPGETVTAQLTEVKKNYCSALSTKIENPAAIRTEPPCPYYRMCGGCQLQHVKTETQSTLKKEWFLETLRRVGRWDETQIERAKELVTINTPAPWNYRQRVRLHFDGKNLGYKKRRSKEIVDIKDCLIASAKIAKRIPEISSHLKMWGQKNPARGLDAEIEITTILDSEKLLFEVVELKCTEKTKESSLSRSLVTHLDLLPFSCKYQSFSICHPYHDNFKVHRKSFVQPHTEAVSLYTKEVIEILRKFFGESLAKDLKREKDLIAWDLYAGSGVFSHLPELVGREFDFKVKTFAVEGVLAATQALQSNVQEFSVSTVTQDVHKFLDCVVETQENVPQIVILDPPRAGLHTEGAQKLLKTLESATGPVLIIYIACDPASLARDAGVLLKSGFSAETLTLFDAFPQTIHYEVVAAFTH